MNDYQTEMIVKELKEMRESVHEDLAMLARVVETLGLSIDSALQRAVASADVLKKGGDLRKPSA